MIQSIQPNDATDNVVCLHSSLSSSRQWESLVQRLRHVYRVSAIDLCGYGNGPKWIDDGAHSLEREVIALGDQLAQLRGPIHLVGHSYGGAVAIRAAREFAPRIRSLTLYEPVLFAALFSHSPCQPASVEVDRLMTDIRTCADNGEPLRATQRFIDYWSGSGSWDAIPAERQQRLSQKIEVLLGNFKAVAEAPNALADLAGIRQPTLYLSGRESPTAINAITNLVRVTLPQATTYAFPGLGHLGPITHSGIVNEQIASFIQRLSGVAYAQGFAQAA